MTKNPKFSKFQSFHAIFVKFSRDFVDWNVEKSQEGTNLLSSSLFRRDLGRKISRWSAGVLFHQNLKRMTNDATVQIEERFTFSKTVVSSKLGYDIKKVGVIASSPIISGLFLILKQF